MSIMSLPSGEYEEMMNAWHATRTFPSFREYVKTLNNNMVSEHYIELREDVIDECLNAICDNCICADECLGYCQHYKALEELKEQKNE